jgi:hypothetical protein
MSEALNIKLVIVATGLPGGIQTAAGGGHEWTRGPAEGRSDFAERVSADAKRLRLFNQTIVIGGLGGARHAGNACRCRACKEGAQ